MSLDIGKSFAQITAEAVQLPMALINQETCEIKFCNPAFRSLNDSSATDLLAAPIYRFDAKDPVIPAIRTSMRDVVKGLSDPFSDIDFEAQLDGLTQRNVCIRLLSVEVNREQLILVTIEDITRRKNAERIVLEQQKRLQWSVDTGMAELETANRDLQSQIVGRERIEAALHESEHALLQSREELRHLSASLMNAQDTERRRVARELHDDLSQKMAKLQFDAETLEQQVPFENIAAARKRLRDVGQQAATVSDDLRRVAHQLHPATLDHLGLAIAVRSYAEEFTRSTAIPVKVTSINVPHEIPIEVSGGLFRIVQEALRNVAKHANSAKVEIVVAGVSGGLALFIRDDGEGFDIESARRKGGLGLISIQERARLLEGKLSLETEPGKGVLLTIQCPIVGGT